MSGDKHRLDELFRNGMEGHSEMPSPLVWDKIEEALNKKDRKRPFILLFTEHKKIWTGIGVALICIALLMIGVCSVESSTERNTELLNKSAAAEKKPSQHTQASPESLATTSKTSTSHSTISEIFPKKHIEIHTKNEDITLNSTHKKEIQKNISLSTQLNQTTTHLSNNVPNKQRLNVKVNSPSDKLAENSKEQPSNRNPSNEAVANLPYASESVPSLNKTDVAGSQAIIQSTGIVNHNASAVQVAEEQTKLAFIAGVNAHQHDLGPIVKSIVSFKPLPIYVKIPTIQASATNVSSANSTSSPNKKTNFKRFHITVTPVLLNQNGTIKVLEKTITPPPPIPGQPPIVWNPPSISSVDATSYTINGGLLTDIHFKNGFSLQTGFTLSTQYFTVNSANGIAVKRPDGSTKYIIDYNIGVVYLDPKFGTNPAIGSIEPINNIKTSIHYAQIPILLNWHLGKGKIQGVISIGGNYTMLTGLSLNTDIAQERIKQKITDKEVNLRFNYLNAIGGLGIKWNVNKQFAFVLASQYHQAVTPFLRTDLIRAYPGNLTTQAGVQIGIFK